jgi:hypothetical protein
MEDISVEFLNYLKKYEDELSRLLRCLNESEGGDHDYFKMFENLVEKENNIREKLSRLQSAITFAKKIDSAQIPRDFIERKENLKSKKLSELNEDFWGPLLPLLKLSSELEPLMDSVSFKNVATSCLSENSSSWLLTCDGNDTDRLHALFKFLAAHAIPQFVMERSTFAND